jgi:hypothetical protein
MWLLDLVRGDGEATDGDALERFEVTLVPLHELHLEPDVWTADPALLLRVVEGLLIILALLHHDIGEEH